MEASFLQKVSKSHIPNSNYDGFNITYEILEGNGELKNSSTAVLTQSTPYAIEPGDFKFSYTPTILGSHVLKFIVKDNFNEEKEVLITNM